MARKRAGELCFGQAQTTESQRIRSNNLGTIRKTDNMCMGSRKDRW